MSNKRQYTVFDGEEERIWEVETLSSGAYRVSTPRGETLEVDSFSVGDNMLHFLCDRRSVDVGYAEQAAGIQIHVEGERHHIEVLNERERRMRAVGGGGSAADAPELTSPMAGKVVKVVAEEGQSVETGDPLVVVEAMKMENDLKAHRPGVVASVAVAAGDAVEIGDVLVIIEDEDQ